MDKHIQFLKESIPMEEIFLVEADNLKDMALEELVLTKKLSGSKTEGLIYTVQSGALYITLVNSDRNLEKELESKEFKVVEDGLYTVLIN